MSLPVRSELAAALRRIRLERDLSLRKAARTAGISREQLTNLENSAFDGCNPTLRTILGLSLAYNLPPSFWFAYQRKPVWPGRRAPKARQAVSP